MVHGIFTFTGEVSYELDRKATTFNIQISYTPSSTNNVTLIDNLDVTTKVKAHSGYFDKAHYDWLTEIGKSTQVEVKVGDVYYPVVITSIDLKAITSQDLYNIDVEYYFSEPENFVKQ